MYGKLIYLKQMLFKGVTMNNKVLIVDDEKLERVLIRKGYDWEANGFEIIGEADSGEEALEFFDVKEPDIVITDIEMPVMGGLELLICHIWMACSLPKGSGSVLQNAV